MLGAADRRQLRAGVVKAALQLEFPAQEAERQLDTIVSWGRYAEIFAYDNGKETMSLEQEAPPSGGEVREGKNSAFQ